MGIELTPAFWSGLAQIILVNIVLSGDNALVIALACRNLEKRHQRPAILIGSAGAIILRIIFVMIVDQLLKIGYLKLVGGLLLLWIGIIQLVCLVLYLVPRTSVLGAVLMTGYLGGAIATHVRVSSPLLTHTLFPIYVALLLWAGLCLREPRLRALVPFRS